MNPSKKTIQENATKTFLKKGTCSRTFFHILNREFGYPQENKELALDPLAGGIMQLGYQCGMLWGSSLAVGAESFRRNDEQGKAIASAITATKNIMESFTNRTKTADCSDITNADLKSKLSMAKYMLTGKFITCFKLAGKWAPEAVQAANEGLSKEQDDLSKTQVSCASEVARKMGASDEEIVMVSGFAGGMGLSGNACGALGAAIWLKTLAWCRENPGKSGYKDVTYNPNAENTLEAFYGATDYELLCSKISVQRFKTIDDHTEFIKNGGCAELIDVLARS
jgi:hypothetical protein